MQKITIAGQTFEVESPYDEGPRTLTEGEAHALNQTRHENIRNNMARFVKDALEKSVNHDEIQAKVAEYDAAYAFGIRQAGEPGISRDPVETEARSLARAAVKARFAEKGVKLETKAVNAAADLILSDEVKGAAFRQAATERVAAKQAEAKRLSEMLGDVQPPNMVGAEESPPV